MVVLGRQGVEAPNKDIGTVSRQICASVCSNAAQRPPVPGKTVLDGELIGFDAVTRLQEMKDKEIRLGQ